MSETHETHEPYRRWGILMGWTKKGRGSYTYLALTTLIPVMFPTRREARTYIKKEYPVQPNQYWSATLRWHRPRAVRVSVCIEQEEQP